MATAGVIALAIWGPGAKKSGGIDPMLPAATAAKSNGPTAIAPPTDTPAAPKTTAATNANAGAAPANNAAAAGAPPAAGATPTAAAPTAGANSTAPVTAAAAAPMPSQKYKARLPAGAVAPTSPAPLGSLDPAKFKYQIQFATTSAGFARIIFSDYWNDAASAQASRRRQLAIANGDANPPPAPDGSHRYELQTVQTLQGYQVPLLGARGVEIDGGAVSLFGAVWAERAPGVFESEIVDDGGAVVLRVTRRFTLAPDSYDMGLEQSVENLSSAAHTIRWIQYGPGDLSMDQGGLMDIRRFQFGYLYNAQRDPSRSNVVVHGAMFERADALKKVTSGAPLLWPQPDQKAQGFELSWYGTTNRYFALAAHAPYAPPARASKALTAVESVFALADPGAAATQTIVCELRSAQVSAAPGQSVRFDMGVYAGPLNPKILEVVEPYAALRMDGLILYLMGGCCSFCTFSWLADLIVIMLTFLHDHVVFDWAIAIMVLVMVVRILLHPITKRSQISMTRVTRGMAAIKPELEALQKRYAGDPKKLQAEQMRLYREKGINPVGCVGGMLPTFLQTPIWIALYAVLYFAFALRQQPAFFGVFQQFGGWEFLGDLSAADHFIRFSAPLIKWPFEFSSINLIPILMGVLFFLQQKYMTPPNTASMTAEQIQQQKMMKWMTVFLFPVMLYNAPSGLTLYIMTSTTIGIFEGKRIRAQMETMDFTPKPRDPAKQDRIGKFYEKAMERARSKREPPKKFKERD
jgi:YidC/Oxa1 family membrane protein insertase